MTLDTAATPGPDRIESLQIMRGLAATSVMMFHFTAANLIFREVYPSFAGAFHYGFLGVEAFFVISGFVIPHAMAEAGYRLRADATTFFLRRLVRLEPAYLVSILFALVIGFVAAHAPGYRGAPFVIEPVRWLLHVAYLVPWFGRDWLNSAYWTLAIEFQYYLAMIVAAPLLIAPGRWKPRVFLLGVLALSTMFEDSRLIFYFLPFFGLGFVAFLLLHARIRIAESVIWATAFAAVWTTVRGDIGMIVGLGAMAFIFVPVRGPVPILSFLGSISYSLYLVHNLIAPRVFNLMTRLPPHAWLQIAALLLSIAITMAIAWLLWRLIERPTALLAKRIGRGQ